ncbi:TetR/AcrR family transcriptional regulator, partial [Candidatus Frankia nodulisporulans]
MSIGTDAPHVKSPGTVGPEGTVEPEGTVGPEGTVRDAAVLDAAKASLLAVGVRRTTLTEVARRAGTSRMTLYRRWPDLRALVGEVMTREWGSIVTAAARLAERDPRGGELDGIVDEIVATVEAFRVNPVYRRILETDAEMLLPYLTERRGATQQMIVDLLAGQLGAAARAGTVRAGDPEALAVMVLLVVQSYVLSADALGGRVPTRTRDGELRRLLHTYPTTDHDPTGGRGLDPESDPAGEPGPGRLFE